MTGDSDYLIRVALPDIAALERYILNQFMPIPGIENIRSNFALKQVRYKTARPLPTARAQTKHWTTLKPPFVNGCGWPTGDPEFTFRIGRHPSHGRQQAIKVRSAPHSCRPAAHSQHRQATRCRHPGQ